MNTNPTIMGRLELAQLGYRKLLGKVRSGPPPDLFFGQNLEEPPLNFSGLRPKSFPSTLPFRQPEESGTLVLVD